MFSSRTLLYKNWFFFVFPKFRYHNTFLRSTSHYWIIISFWKIGFIAKNKIWIFNKTSKFFNIHMLFITNVLCKHFASQHRFWSHILPCRKYGTNHWYTIKHWKVRFIFYIFTYTVSKKEKIKKILRQSNTIFHRAVLLGP
jgi:hypothetical protein